MTTTTVVGPKSRKANPNRGAKPGERRGGRAKGTPNKMTRELKEMILGALEDVGGQKYLAAQAKKSPAAFMTLLGKVLPMQVTGEGGGPVQVATIDAGKLSDAVLQELLSARRAAADAG